MLELQEIAGVFTGVAIREHQGTNGSARFMRLADLTDIKAGQEPQLASGDPSTAARALTIQQGDVVIGARGQFTDACVPTGPALGAFVCLDLYLVRPNLERVDPQFLAAFLMLPATQGLLAAAKQGSSLARLPKEALEKIKIPLPSMQVQKRIAKLALLFQEEEALLKRLTRLNSTLSRETIARAIQAGAQQVSRS